MPTWLPIASGIVARIDGGMLADVLAGTLTGTGAGTMPGTLDAFVDIMTGTGKPINRGFGRDVFLNGGMLADALVGTLNGTLAGTMPGTLEGTAMTRMLAGSVRADKMLGGAFLGMMADILAGTATPSNEGMGGGVLAKYSILGGTSDAIYGEVACWSSSRRIDPLVLAPCH